MNCECCQGTSDCIKGWLNQSSFCCIHSHEGQIYGKFGPVPSKLTIYLLLYHYNNCTML